MLNLQQVIDVLHHRGMSSGAHAESTAHIFFKNYSQFVDGISRESLIQLSEEAKIKLLQIFEFTKPVLLEHLPLFTNGVDFSKLCEVFRMATGHSIESMSVSPQQLGSDFYDLYCAILMHPDCPTDVLIHGITLSPYLIGHAFKEKEGHLIKFVNAVNSLPISERFMIFMDCKLEINTFDMPLDRDFIALLPNDGNHNDELRDKYVQRLLASGYQLSEDVLDDRIREGKYSYHFIIKQENLSLKALKSIAKEKIYVANHPNWPVEKVISAIGSNANSAYNHTHAGLHRVPKDILMAEIKSPTKAQSLTAMASAEGLPEDIYDAVLEKLICNVNDQWNDPNVELSSTKTPLIGPAYSLYCFVRNNKIPSHIFSLALDDLSRLKNQNLASYFKKTIYANNALSPETCISELKKLQALPGAITGKDKELLTSLLTNQNMPSSIRKEYITFNAISVQQVIIRDVIAGKINLSASELLSFYKRLKVDPHVIYDLSKFTYPKIASCGDEKLLRQFISVSSKPHLWPTFVNCIGHLYTCSSLDREHFKEINNTLSKVITKAYAESDSKPDGLNNTTINKIYTGMVSADFICGIYDRVREKFNIAFDVNEIADETSLPNQLAKLRGQEVLDFFMAQHLKARLTNIEQERAPMLELAKPRARSL
ncbi:hypothetical protein ACEUAI_12850 [Aeromonas veronii]